MKNNSYFGICDVEGCNNVARCGGVCWENTGYWKCCSQHHKNYIDGYLQPEMKKSAIKREKRRLPNGILPNK